MADVATLGLQVESASVRKGADDLNKLSGAAARAEAATDGLAGANRGAAGAAAATAHAYAKEGASAASASKQLEMFNRAANQNARGPVGRGNVANLAAQFQDVAVSAQMGMGALQIGLQQGTQLAAVIATMENPVRGLAQAFAAVLSPASLLTITLVSLVAVGIQMVDWPKLAASALHALADVLEDIAPYAIGAAAALALLYAPAIIGGIITVIALLGRLAVAAVTAAAAIIAVNPIGAFVLGITAAVAAANIFRDELTQIFGRDIVSDAKNGVNFIVAAFVGGFNGIKAIWGALPSVLGDLVYSTVAGVINAIESMINSAIGGINNLINEAKMASLKIGVPLNVDFISAVTIDKPANPYAGATEAATSKLLEEMKAAQGTDYVGGVTDAIARGASAASDKLKELAKGLTDVDEKAKKKGSGKTDTEKYSDIVDGAERRIASLEAEKRAIGMTEEAAAALRYETELLNQAQQRGITLSDAQKGELSALAQVMASVGAETKRMGEAIEFSKDLTKGFLDDFFSGLESGKSVWESFGDAALGVLDRIADKLLNDLVDAFFEVSSAASGSGGGILGGILSLFGGGAASDPWAGLRGYATGTPAASPGVKWVGEKGPELVRFKGGEEVIPNHKLRASNENARAASAQNVNFNMSLEVKGTGDKELLEQARQGAAAQMSEALKTYDKKMPDRVQQINRNPRQRAS